MVKGGKKINIMSNPGGYLTPEMIKELVTKGCKNPRDKVFIYTLFDSARRVSEWINIRWMDIKWEKRLVFCPILKKGRVEQLHIALGVVSMDLLTRYRDMLSSGEIRHRKDVDLSPQGKVFPFTRQYAESIVKRAAIRAGITDIGEKKKKMHCHILRHSKAMQCLNSGMPIEIISRDILCHSNIGTTMQYLQTTGDDRRILRDKYLGRD